MEVNGASPALAHLTNKGKYSMLFSTIPLHMTSSSKYYAYARFSSMKQADGSSEKRQQTDAERWCEQNKIDPNDVVNLVDRGASGFRAKNLKLTAALGRFRNDAKLGRVPAGSYLLVEAMDRMTRLPVDEAAGLLLEITGLGIKIVTLHDGAVYEKPLSLERLIMAVLALDAANAYSRRLSTRIADSWRIKREAAASGKKVTPHGSPPAWLVKEKDASGENSKWVVHEERAKTVIAIFKMCEAGMTAHAIAKTLNVKNVPPFQSRQRKAYGWHAATIRHLLLSRTVLGEYQPKSVVYKDGAAVGSRVEGDPLIDYYPAVISPDLWAATRSNRPTVAKRGRPTADQEANLFRGLTFNGEGEILNYRKKLGREYLIPRLAALKGQTRGKNFNYTLLEKSFIPYFLEADWNDFIIADAVVNAEQEKTALVEEIKAAEKERENYTRAVGLGGDLPILIAKLREAERRIAKAKERLAEIEQPVAAVQRPEAVAADNVDQRRAIRSAIASVVTRITLYPPESVPADFALDASRAKIAYTVTFKSGAVRNITATPNGYLSADPTADDGLMIRGRRAKSNHPVNQRVDEKLPSLEDDSSIDGSNTGKAAVSTKKEESVVAS